MDLTEKFFQANDVNQLVEQLSDILQKAIIVENHKFELIAYSSPNEISFDPVQQKTILTKRCPLFIIERLKKEGIIERLKLKSKPVYIPAMEDIGFDQRIVFSLKHHNLLQGYLWINVENDWFETEDLSFITKITPYIGKLLFDEQKTVENAMKTVIWKLINDEFINEVEKYRAANIASYEIPDQYTVVVASVQKLNYLSVLGKIKNLFIKQDVASYLGKGTEIVCIVD